MNEIIEKENITVENMIYEVRGVEAMLINEAVKNNLEKFPERFSFILDNFEGESYDAYSIPLDILNSFIKEIIIIDNYAGAVHR